MKSKLYTFIALVSLSLLVSCRTAKKMYEKGNYDEAVELAVKKLQKKPNDAATLDILQQAYRYAVEDHEARIRSNAISNSDLRWEWTYAEYLDLQRLYDAIRKAPAVFEIVQPADYSSYVVSFKQEAGNARFQRGLALLAQGNRESAKQAYFEFQQALALMPGDINTRQKMDEAYEEAVVNVVVMPAVQSGYQYSSYNYGIVSFDNSLLRYLNSNGGSYFVRYFSPAEAESRQIRADQVVEIRMNDLDIDRYRDQRSPREISKQVVVKETVIRPDSVVKEYATVKARITTVRRTLEGDGAIQVTVRDAAGNWMWNDTYRSDYRWSSEFSSWTGDARALTEEDKKLCDRREQYPPSESDIARILVDELQGKAECGIRGYFNRF